MEGGLARAVVFITRGACEVSLEVLSRKIPFTVCGYWTLIEFAADLRCSLRTDYFCRKSLRTLALPIVRCNRTISMVDKDEGSSFARWRVAAERLGRSSILCRSSLPTVELGRVELSFLKCLNLLEDIAPTILLSSLTIRLDEETLPIRGCKSA